jgi:hypothetical protein
MSKSKFSPGDGWGRRKRTKSGRLVRKYNKIQIQYILDTGQARNKLLAQWVQLTNHAAGHSKPGTTHLPASQGEGVRAGRLLASSTCSSPGGPTLSSGVLVTV